MSKSASLKLGNLGKLGKLVKKCKSKIRKFRTIRTFPNFKPGLKPIFKELKILDVKCTNVLEKSKYMYKSKNHLLPVTIANHFEESSQVESHSYNLRSTGRPRSVVTRLLSSEKSIQISGERLWNKIPDSTKLFSSLSIFKRDMKASLLEGTI